MVGASDATRSFAEKSTVASFTVDVELEVDVTCVLEDMKAKQV